jgi:hypothetical protein
MSRMHRQRAQALVETAIFMPLLLISIGGILWTGQTLIIQERMWSSLRYSGEIEFPVSVANAMNLNTVYDTANNGGAVLQKDFAGCGKPHTNWYDSINYNVGGIRNVTRVPFFVAITPMPSTCSTGTFMLRGHGLTRDLISSWSVEDAYGQARSGLNGFLPSNLQNTIGLIRIHVSQSFFNAPSVAQILQAYPDTIAQAVKASLHDGSLGINDPTTLFDAGQAAAWNMAPPTAPLSISPSGQSDQPGAYTPNSPGAAPGLPPAPPGSNSEGTGSSGSGQTGGVHG